MAKRKESKQMGKENERRIKRNRNIVPKRVKMKRKQALKKKAERKLVLPEGSTDYLEAGNRVLVVDLMQQGSVNGNPSRQVTSEECQEEVTNSSLLSMGNTHRKNDQVNPQTSISGRQRLSEISLELSGIENLEKTSKQVDEDKGKFSANEGSFLSSTPRSEGTQLKRKKIKKIPTDKRKHSKRVLIVDSMQHPANLCKEHDEGESSGMTSNISSLTNNDQLATISPAIRKRERTSKKNNKNDKIGILSSNSSLSQKSTLCGHPKENFSRIDLPDVSIVDVDDDFMYDNEEGTWEIENDELEISESYSTDSGDGGEIEGSHQIHQRIGSDSELEQDENDSENDITGNNSSLKCKSFEVTAEGINSPFSSSKKMTKTEKDLQGSRSDCNNEDQINSGIYSSPVVQVSGSGSKDNVSQEEADLNPASKQNSKKSRKKCPKIKKVKKDETPFRLFQHTESGKAVLIFPQDAEAPFVGRVFLQTLIGSVTVNGFKVKANHCWYPIYATANANISTLKVKVLDNKSQRKHEAEVSVIERLKFEKDKATLTTMAANGPFAALMLQRLECNAWNYAKQLNLSEYAGDVTVNHEFPISMQYSEIFHELGFFLYPLKYCGVSQLKPIKTLPGQENAIGTILDCYKENNEVPVVVICGHQGSGKSTFSRNLVNCFLNETDAICYIEADTGQSELTPSCLLSLHYLTEPLLGTPFVHQRQPAKMFFFGSNETKKSPDLYLEMLAALHQYYTETFPSKPLVVNTNGWVTGLGACLLTDMLHIMKPTQIVLLKNDDQLTPSDYFSDRSWLGNKDARNLLSTSILTVQAAPKNPLGSKVLRRNMTLVGYLSTLFKPSLIGQKFRLSSITPYVVPWSSVAVHVCNHTISTNHILYALNASIVGLCAVDPSKMFEIEGSVPSDGLPKILKETPVCDCLGLGIVRGIDPVMKVFYIITPVAVEELPRVTALIKGTHSLPHSMLKEDFDLDKLPYVATSLNPVPVSQPFLTTKRFSRNPWAVIKNMRNMATKTT
ncbi:Polynucleotide 5'-hydroxyl-kinase NOL9 [Holothuria leucospilota]|uniref:Polynucleotide 5'-hydroxyl-kinase NOL9 n=1 Tax=Holothuria leucospilota TaxID=206669 RepID=A0A9Q1HHS8_HOLLE|nr:Polynucleotide 5'-hydroxyl-kinase NOL9 [Holothuria leucospilota]